jgi:serine/threonine-protein kinase RsbW
MSVSEDEATGAALDACYPAQPSQIAAIRTAVADVARLFGAGETALLNIELAVSEAATNAVLHAYRDRGIAQAGDVRVVVKPGDEGVLDVHLCDRGIGLSPRADSPGMGLGLGLMAHETQCFEVRTAPDGGTEVVLRFQL